MLKNVKLTYQKAMMFINKRNKTHLFFFHDLEIFFQKKNKKNPIKMKISKFRN